VRPRGVSPAPTFDREPRREGRPAPTNASHRDPYSNAPANTSRQLRIRQLACFSLHRHRGTRRDDPRPPSCLTQQSPTSSRSISEPTPPAEMNLVCPRSNCDEPRVCSIAALSRSELARMAAAQGASEGRGGFGRNEAESRTAGDDIPLLR